MLNINPAITLTFAETTSQSGIIGNPSSLALIVDGMELYKHINITVVNNEKAIESFEKIDLYI